jgi:hypothetical protein
LGVLATFGVTAAIAVPLLAGSSTGSQTREHRALKRVIALGGMNRLFSNKLGASACTIELGGVATTYHPGTCTTSVDLGKDGSAVVTLAGKWSPHHFFWRTWKYGVSRNGQVTFQGTDGNLLPPNPL